jgi:hypothetical protein
MVEAPSRRLVFALLLASACATAGPPPPETAQGTTTSAEGTAVASERERVLAANAPADRPVALVGPSADESLARWRALIAPHVATARATYPDAKRRYLAGLPRGETFFVTTVLRDSEGRFEQVFLRVDRIDNGIVTGRIYSEIATVRGYRAKDTVKVAEAEIVDWMISRPDGSEEGNVVGKFIDTLPSTVR